MLSTVGASKPVPLGLCNTPVYIQLLVYLHQEREILAKILRVVGTQVPAWVSAGIAA